MRHSWSAMVRVALALIAAILTSAFGRVCHLSRTLTDQILAIQEGLSVENGPRAMEMRSRLVECVAGGHGLSEACLTAVLAEYGIGDSAAMKSLARLAVEGSSGEPGTEGAALKRFSERALRAIHSLSDRLEGAGLQRVLGDNGHVQALAKVLDEMRRGARPDASEGEA